MSRAYADGTTVSASRTKGEIEDMLMRRGVDKFGSMGDRSRVIIAFEYQKVGYQIEINIPSRDEPRFTSYKQGSTIFRRVDTQIEKLYNDEVNRKWRALGAVIKAKLIAVDEGITSFEREFLAYVSIGNGLTLGDQMIPEVKAAALAGRMPNTVLSLPGRSE